MRVKEGYYEQIERIAEIYPDKVALSVSETARVLGIDRRTVTALIKSKKLTATDVSTGKNNSRYIIPVSAVAKFSVG